MEERLDRLERMVRSLATQQKRARADGANKAHREPRSVVKPDAFGAFKSDAQRESARAAELERRALKQAERARQLEEQRREKGGTPDEPQAQLAAQLQALQQARESLQRELQKLERQMEQIKRDAERSKKESRSRDKDERDESP